MTGAALSNPVINFFEFFSAIAVIVMVGCGALFAVCVSGYLTPYSRWGGFLDRYLTGYSSLFGPNFTWYTGLGAVIAFVLWSALSLLIERIMQLMSSF